jgi:hypothetical protein
VLDVHMDKSTTGDGQQYRLLSQPEAQLCTHTVGGVEAHQVSSSSHTPLLNFCKCSL